MIPPANFPSARLIAFVFFLIALLYLGTSFTPVIFDDNEGLYAGAVREMHERGDWLLPTNNGFPRIQKPPLVYWTMLVSTSLFGFNEFALRLPNTLATLLWISSTFLIFNRITGKCLGLVAAVTHASLLGVCIFTHLVQPEPFLAAFISLSIWCLLEMLWRSEKNEPTSLWITAFWICLALGVMSKGLHGALWPLGTVILTSLFIPSTRSWLRTVWSLRGQGLFLLLVLPWYLYMSWKLPGFLSAHFVNEQIGATLNTRFPPDAKQLSLAQFYLQHFIFWLPWTLLFPGAVHIAITQQQHLNSLQKKAVFLLSAWVLLTLLSLAFSTRQDYYSLSCWGMVAGFLALPWVINSKTTTHLPRPYVLVPSLLLVVAGGLSLGLSAWLAPVLNQNSAMTSPIQQRDTFADALAGISPGLWAQFLPLLALFGVAMLIGGLGASWLTWKKQNLSAFAFYSGVISVPFIFAAIGFTLMSSYFSLAENARALNTELAQYPEATVACEALPNTASSLFCYLNTRVHWVNAPYNNQYAQQVLGQGRDYYWQEHELLNHWMASSRLYFIIEESRLEYWKQHFTIAPKIIHRAGTRVVLCNQ